MRWLAASFESHAPPSKRCCSRMPTTVAYQSIISSGRVVFSVTWWRIGLGISDQRGDVGLVGNAEQRLAVDLGVDLGQHDRMARGGRGVPPEPLERAGIGEARGAGCREDYFYGPSGLGDGIAGVRPDLRALEIVERLGRGGGLVDPPRGAAHVQVCGLD